MTAPREGAGAVGMGHFGALANRVRFTHDARCAATNGPTFLVERCNCTARLAMQAMETLRTLASAPPAPAPAGEGDAALLEYAADALTLCADACECPTCFTTTGDCERGTTLREKAVRLRALAAALAGARADGERLDWLEAHDGELVYDEPSGDDGEAWEAHATDENGRPSPTLLGTGNTVRDAIDAARRAGAAGGEG